MVKTLVYGLWLQDDNIILRVRRLYWFIIHYLYYIDINY